MKNLICHQRSIHQNSGTFFGTECGHTTARKHDLNRHIMKRHANTPLTSNLSPKVACREPHIINPPPNDHLLDQNTQRGFGLSPTDVPDEVHRFFQEEQPWGTDQNRRQVYVQIFIAFAKQKPSTGDQEPTFDTSTTPRLSLIPLSMPLRISFDVKPTLSRSTSLFLSFCNTGRLESSDIIMPATTTNY